MYDAKQSANTKGEKETNEKKEDCIKTRIQ